MAAFRSSSIGARLAFGFGAVLCCTALVAGLAIWQLSKLQEGVASIVGRQVEALIGAMEMQEKAGDMSLTLRRIAAPSSEEEGAKARDRLRVLVTAYRGAEERVAARLNDAVARALLDDARAGFQAVLPHVKTVSEQGEAGNYFDAASALANEYMPLRDPWASSLARLAAHQKRQVDNTYAGIVRDQTFARKAMVAAGVFAVAIGAVLAWLIGRSVVLPLAQVTRAAGAIADRDLRNRIEPDGSDEVTCSPELVRR